jgi:hypothetical protein
MKDWVKGCDMGFYVGQKVNSARGNGVVIKICSENNYPVHVMFRGFEETYMIDGRLFLEHELPSVYPIELTPKFYQPEWQPKEGEWCWFWDNTHENHIRVVAKYLGMTRDKRYICKVKDDDDLFYENCAPFDGKMTPPWERGEEK